MSLDLPDDAAALARGLVAWFEANRRDLPWRVDRTPYRVWLSEIMLQQTRVAVVEEYYRRFLARFPDVGALAAADLDEVLSLWSGLGYYSRGRNLHAAAQAVVARGGAFPDSVDELRRLPGVGPYTAAAVASLAFGVKAAVVDGNVARVLARLCDDERPVDDGAGKARAAARAQALVDAALAPGPVNEGMMELGALVCTPKSPRCDACPFRVPCRARARGTAALRPVKGDKRPRKALRVAVALVHDADAVWLERREAKGLFGGLFEPPSRALAPGDRPTDAVRALLEERGLPAPSRLPRPVVVRRTLTHRDLTLDVLPVRVPRASCPAAAWYSAADLSRVGVSTATRAVLEAAWPGMGRGTLDLFFGDGGSAD